MLESQPAYCYGNPVGLSNRADTIHSIYSALSLPGLAASASGIKPARRNQDKAATAVDCNRCYLEKIEENPALSPGIANAAQIKPDREPDIPL